MNARIVLVCFAVSLASCSTPDAAPDGGFLVDATFLDGTTPSDARKPEYHDQLLRVNTQENDQAKGDAKLQVGDRVRVALANSTFKRGFNINWSENIHIVTAVHPTQPPTYTVSLNNVRKKGTYYEPQLLKSKF